MMAQQQCVFLLPLIALYLFFLASTQMCPFMQRFTHLPKKGKILGLIPGGDTNSLWDCVRKGIQRKDRSHQTRRAICCRDPLNDPKVASYVDTFSTFLFTHQAVKNFIVVVWFGCAANLRELCSIRRNGFGCWCWIWSSLSGMQQLSSVLSHSHQILAQRKLLGFSLKSVLEDLSL